MEQDRQVKAVANWIFLGVSMLVIQVLLGGITRLTGSGLSITEWKPIMGALPPATESEWQNAFTKYQQIAQYKYLNQHFSLGNFKFIFFWEWFHRLWARLIGLVFLFPFFYFLIKGYFKNWMVVPLVILFLLGAMQGAVGWIMVMSGLNDDDLYVNHIKLAVHFMSAMVLICYALVFGLKLTVPKKYKVFEPSLFNSAIVLTVLISVQLVFGAFMAGLKAAAAASSWPDINGYFIPSGVFSSVHKIANDKITVHFIHRTLAYIIALFVTIFWIKAKTITFSPAFNLFRNIGVVLVLFQLSLGIATVLSSTKIVAGQFGIFETLALLHQLTGMLLLLCFVSIVYLLDKNSQPNLAEVV